MEVCAVVLAAGEGRRLRPLTEIRPKALCPVGNEPLLHLALARVAGLGFAGPEQVAVNASYLASQVVAQVGDRATVSPEESPMGTAGGVARLRRWIDGRGVLVGNADAYLAGDGLAALLDGWDGRTVRLLGVPGVPAEFGAHRFAGFSLLPWRYVRELPATRAELVRTVWRPAEAAGALEVVVFGGTYRDTGTPPGYLAANLHAAGGAALVDPAATVSGTVAESVVGAGATVAGAVHRCVVWPGATVAAGEALERVIRAGRDVTVRA
jgi:N-acetyl-alpha-D-muramate 1-phosphate uridylyltransferase